MKLLAILAAFAAGAATHFLLGRRNTQEQDEHVMAGSSTYELDHDEAVIEDAPDMTKEQEGREEQEETEAPVQIGAVIAESCREMDPITLRGASRLSFRCEDGEKRDFFIPGESGVHLVSGERGTLEYQGLTFLSFTKESGEVVGALFHIPAEEAAQ